MKFYKDSSGVYWLGDTTCPAGAFTLIVKDQATDISLVPNEEHALHYPANYNVAPSFFKKSDNTAYASYSELYSAVGGFFDNASGDRGDSFLSAGTVDKPTWTDNGDGTITIGVGSYRFFSATDYTGIITEYTIAETILSPADNTTSYVIASLNDGNPILQLSVNIAAVEDATNCVVYTVYRKGIELSIIDWDEPGLGLPNKIHRRLIETNRFSRVYGFELGELGTRNISINAGKVWQGVYPNSLTAYDSTTSNAYLLLQDGLGDWSYSSVSQYPNTQYDNGTGTPATLTDGNYAVVWVYRSMSATTRVYMLLGNGDYTLDQAKSSQPPTTPSGITTNSLLIGRIIVLKGAATATQIDSAFQTLFAPSSVPNGVVIGSMQMFAGTTAPSGYLLCQGQAVSRTTYAALFNVISTTYGVGDGSTTFNVPNLKGRVAIGAGQDVFISSFANTDVNTTTNIITVPSNRSLFTGSIVVLGTNGTAPAGLTSGNTYYAIRLSYTTIQLASTLANAVAGTAIDITSQGTGTHTLTITYTDRILGNIGGEETHALTIAEIPSHKHIINDSYGTQDLESYINNGNATDEITRNEDTSYTGGSTEHNIMSPYTVMNFIIKY